MILLAGAGHVALLPRWELDQWSIGASTANSAMAALIVHPCQGRVLQGDLSGSSGDLADNEVSNGLGWKQSKQNRSTCSVEG